MDFEISPERAMKTQNSIAISAEINVLKLAPFSPILKIFFEDIEIGREAIQFLSVQNPTGQKTMVTVVKLPPADRNIELNWHGTQINPQSKIVLNIKWIPKEEGNWRDTLSLVDGRNVRRDIVHSTCLSIVKIK